MEGRLTTPAPLSMWYETGMKVLTDYEKYIRTDELLSLQKPPERLVCHDELQFQTVHQVAELWMKLVEHELLHAAAAMREGQPARAGRTLGRVKEIQRLLHEQL